MTLQLHAAAVTHPGLIRSGNQDAVHVGRWLVAVADGMGGMAAGDLASGLAMAAMVTADVARSDEELVPTLRGAVEAATARIREAVDEDPSRDGMGTTLTALLCSHTGRTLALVHIGDSRAYLLRDGVLEQVTRDDTLVQLLVEQGAISAAEAAVHPRRAVVTQALQGGPVSPFFTTFEPRAGDRWLLCSDGLSNVVDARSLTETLLAEQGRQDCAHRLVELALRGGGPDNISAIVADITSE
ncbi:MAG TPA: protein phosphatase 2C domain-containing protein [Micromonosporaceae bacterium]